MFTRLLIVLAVLTVLSCNATDAPTRRQVVATVEARVDDSVVAVFIVQRDYSDFVVAPGCLRFLADTVVTLRLTLQAQGRVGTAALQYQPATAPFLRMTATNTDVRIDVLPASSCN